MGERGTFAGGLRQYKQRHHRKKKEDEGMKRIVRQRAAGLTALLLALLVLSGCGGGSDKSESSVAQNTNGSMADIQPMEPAAAPELGGGWDMVTTDEMPRDTFFFIDCE